MYAFDGGPFAGAIEWGKWTLQPTTGNIIFTGGSVSSNFDPITNVISVKPYSGDTGISNVSASKKTNITYTLDGRRVENPTKGVYIVNGKMFVIK